MFGFLVSLIVLSVMFTVFAGAAFLIRKSLLCGREGRMYPVWILILLLSIVPFTIRFSLPDTLPVIPESPREEASAEAVPMQYEGDYSEILRARTLHANRAPTLRIPERLPEPDSPLELGIRRFLAASFRYLDDIAAAAFVLWLAGAAIRFAGAMVSYHGTTRLLMLHSKPCGDERIRRLLDECGKGIGLRRHVRVRMFDIGSVCSPCVSGCIRPILYLDPSCAELSDRELACVLTHELTHIRRCDMLLKLFAIFVTSVHWLNPVSRHVQRAVFEDCELACDYSVVKAFGSEISGLYMSTILDFVERFSESNRLACRGGISGGLFLGKPSGTAFLKRRYANMKNYRKDRAAMILTGAFIALCAALNTLALSSCSGITPGMIGSAIELTPPVEQMVRSYYGLSGDDFITPDMVDGITSLSVEVNEFYDDHILVEFTVGGKKYQGEPLKCEALPMTVIASYYDNYIIPVIEESDSLRNETSYVDTSGNTVKADDADRMRAFYQLKDPFDASLTPRAQRELIATFPPCVERPIYIRDPFASEREVTRLYQVLDDAGLLDAWEIDSYSFDTTSFAYFANLEEVEFIGLDPVGYDFPDTVKVTVKEKDADTPDDVYLPNPEPAISNPADWSYNFELPTDGSVIAIPVNASLNYAIREYLVMENWNYEKTPLTSKHLEEITSIKAELDDELSIHLGAAGKASGTDAFAQCRYIRWTINGYTLDVIPHYLTELDYSGLWQSLDGLALPVSKLVQSSYTWSEDYGCYVLNDSVTEDEKLLMFDHIAEISLMKVVFTEKTESDAYRTEFHSPSSKVGGTPARYLDSVSTFDESDKALFPNLTEWEISLN